MTGRHGRLFKYNKNRKKGDPGDVPSPPNLLVVENSDAELLDPEVGEYLVSRRLSRDNLEALKYLDVDFEDFNIAAENESNPDVIPFQKRHYIAWCNALTKTHFRMGIRRTGIPIAATSALTHHLTKWKRLRRWLIQLCCCTEKCKGKATLGSDYTRNESLIRFEKEVVIQSDIDSRPVPPKEVAKKARRFKLFDRFAPSYFHTVELPKFMRPRSSLA